MPAFTKPPTALVEVFERAVGDMPDVQPRRMFGYPAAFTNTQMFACLFQDNMIVRLSEQDRAALAREGVRRFEPMPGRPMREYVVRNAFSTRRLRCTSGSRKRTATPRRCRRRRSAEIVA